MPLRHPSIPRSGYSRSNESDRWIELKEKKAHREKKMDRHAQMVKVQRTSLDSSSDIDVRGLPWQSKKHFKGDTKRHTEMA
jgi:hypothetical protein